MEDLNKKTLSGLPLLLVDMAAAFFVGEANSQDRYCPFLKKGGILWARLISLCVHRGDSPDRLIRNTIAFRFLTDCQRINIKGVTYVKR
jgi:hypothetical protein